LKRQRFVVGPAARISRRLHLEVGDGVRIVCRQPQNLAFLAFGDDPDRSVLCDLHVAYATPDLDAFLLTGTGMSPDAGLWRPNPGQRA
jgi:hypothetical protein